MKILLDTCTLLWLVLDDDLLSEDARAHFRDPDHEIFLSAASALEIATKIGMGRLSLPSPAAEFVPKARADFRIESLAIDEESALHVARLPMLHRDPFDRLLVAQAIVHGLVLMTPDAAIRQYPARTLW